MTSIRHPPGRRVRPTHRATHAAILRAGFAAGLLASVAVIAPAADAPSPPPAVVATATVRVSDATNTPVEGATVRLYALDDSTTSYQGDSRVPHRAHRTGARTTTGKDGVARLPRPTAPSVFTVVVRPPEAKTATLADHVLERWGGGDLEVVLPPATSIAGRVLAPSGAPAPFALVSLDRPDARGVAELAACDAQGTFRLLRVAPGTLRLRARFAHAPDGEPDGAGAAVDVVAGAQDVELRLAAAPPPQPPAIRVRAVAPDGRCVWRGTAAFSSTQARSAGGASTTSSWSTTSGFELGTATLATRPAAAVEVFACADAFGECLPFAPTSAGPFKARGEYEVRLKPGVEVAGDVRADDGTPAPGVRIEAMSAPAGSVPPADPEAFHRWTMTSGARVEGWDTTDLEGRFRIASLAKGAYVLVTIPAAPWIAGPPTVVNAGDRAIRLRAERAHDVTVTVVDTDGTPLAGAQIYVFPIPNPGGSWEPTRTDARGRAVFAGLDLRRLYTLQVGAPYRRLDDFAPFERRWTPADETVRLRRAFFVRGTARAKDGAALPFATLHGVAVDPPIDAPTERLGKAEADGTFRLGPFAEGPVRIAAFSPLPGEGVHTGHRREKPDASWLVVTPGGAPIDVRAR